MGERRVRPLPLNITDTISIEPKGAGSGRRRTLVISAIPRENGEVDAPRLQCLIKATPHYHVHRRRNRRRQH